MTFRIRRKDQPRMVWLLAFLTFIFGCRTIASSESSIAKVSVATQELASRIKTNDRALAQAASLTRREQLAWADLMQISRGQQPAVSVAEFLRRLEEIAAGLKLSIVSITPSAELAVSKAAGTALIPQPITVLVHGDFRSLVRFIQEATRQKTLTGLENAQLVLSSLPSVRTAGLDATIHVTLYRLILNGADVSAN